MTQRINHAYCLLYNIIDASSRYPSSASQLSSIKETGEKFSEGDLEKSKLLILLYFGNI